MIFDASYAWMIFDNNVHSSVVRVDRSCWSRLNGFGYQGKQTIIHPVTSQMPSVLPEGGDFRSLANREGETVFSLFAQGAESESRSSLIASIFEVDMQNRHRGCVDRWRSCHRVDNEVDAMRMPSNERCRRALAWLLTDGFPPWRRKKALQDMQVIRSKLMPRATSPQTRQIRGRPAVRFVRAIAESVVVWLDWQYVNCRQP